MHQLACAMQDAEGCGWEGSYRAGVLSDSEPQLSIFSLCVHAPCSATCSSCATLLMFHSWSPVQGGAAGPAGQCS